MTGTLRFGPIVSAARLDPGAILGSWQIVELVGQGSMGCVYRARHLKLGRPAAVKVLNAESLSNPELVQRFFREARVVNEIAHEHIVEVTDFVEEPGIAYLVMELVEGESVRALLGREGEAYPSVERLLGILRQVCDALSAAHAKGVVHRDLKPDNVLVGRRGGGDFVKVLDFGVARLVEDVDLASTAAGLVIGTPQYMSPEQVLGRPVGPDADVWAAGVVLFEALAGKVPFAAPSFVELAQAIREAPPAPLPARTPRGEPIPRWLARVVARCLAKRPGDRYASMAELRAALAGPPPGRRSLRPVAVALAVALAAGGGAPAWPRLERLRDPGGSAARPATAAGPQAGTIRLHVESDPPGASAVRLDTGQRLGTTPLWVELPRRPGTLWIEVRLEGHESVRIPANLRDDVDAVVSLPRRRR